MWLSNHQSVGSCAAAPPQLSPHTRNRAWSKILNGVSIPFIPQCYPRPILHSTPKDFTATLQGATHSQSNSIWSIHIPALCFLVSEIPSGHPRDVYSALFLN